MSLFPLVCRVGKYAAHGAISPATIRALFNDAARHNGALEKYGPRWLDAEISRALARCTNDAIPPIARCFRAQNPQRQEVRP